ncbi:hypothetical protein T11_571 [Trichinella zimbabwensis]|uniref:Protein kinase domain-containing protein n=1 Tax=Trichinella zimbabwensis TaxID=268475 RepID=A0A0V1I3P9_9BILA|nr:hypothetical protein T11_571 [Trichinella zimbabwensis]
MKVKFAEQKTDMGLCSWLIIVNIALFPYFSATADEIDAAPSDFFIHTFLSKASTQKRLGGRNFPMVSLDLQPLIRAAIAKPDVYVPTPAKRPGARFRGLQPQAWRFYWKKNRPVKRQPNNPLVWIDIDDDQDSAEMKNKQKRGGGRYVNWHFANDADWKRGGGRYFPWYDGPWSHYWKTVPILTVVLRVLFVHLTNKLSLVLCLIVIATASKQISVRTNLLPSAITTIREKLFYSTNSTTTTLKQTVDYTALYTEFSPHSYYYYYYFYFYNSYRVLFNVGVNETPWHVKSYLGKGCFGAIVVAVNKETGQEAALKLEDANQEIRRLRL